MLYGWGIEAQLIYNEYEYTIPVQLQWVVKKKKVFKDS